MRLINLDQEKDIFQLILLIFLLSYGLLFLYPALLLTTFVIVLIWHKNGLTYVADLMGQLNDSKRIFIIITLLLPLTVFAYLFLQAGHDKSGYLENGTSSAIQGGVFYPLMQISAWGLYNTWSPRAILSFHSYFFENPYRLLSISLIALLFYFLIKNKKFMPIYAIVFLAFFAKGPNAPFGEFFLAIINHFPLGYMIRSPDTKFGAFIAAWFAISVYYLTSKQRIAVVTLMGIFLLTNIVGIYSHGAISSIRGDIATTTFIEDPESRKIIDLINGQKNSLLITNFESCSEELYENKLHTCHGLIATSINRQLVHAQGRRIEDIITKYEMFPTLILINKRLRKEKNVPKDLLSHVHMLYDSNNYSLYYRESTNESCKNWHSFGCIRKNSSIVLSIPQSAYKYYYGGEYTTTEDGFIALPQEPLDAKDMPRNILFTLCGLAYLLIFIVVITGLKKSKLFFKN